MNRSVLAAVLVLGLVANAARADFTPVHPYVYMDASDIAVMKDNVLVKKYPWAVALYNQAKASNKSGYWSYLTYQIGKDMMGCALVYLIDGDKSYADGAVNFLNQFKNNYDPLDQTLRPDGITLEKAYHFHPIQVLAPIVYDLMYNYMAANRPADLAALTTYLEWLADRFRNNGNFGHNENHQNHYGEGMCGYALGRADHISTVETDFKEWAEGKNNCVFGGFHYEPGAQAMKHFAYVFESQVNYVNAAHRAAQKGYTTWDPVTWKTTQGWNVINDSWRFLMKKATPLFQVPYETMWRGNLYLASTCSGFYNIAYCMTGNEEWQAIAAQNISRQIIPHHTVNTNWAGLSHGREIVGMPRFKNDCVKNDAIGFNIIYSGDPNGFTDPNTSLHAYMMTKNFGSVVLMNLKLYGKGKKLNVCPLDGPTDAWGERGNGGSIVNQWISTDITDVSTEHCWDVTDPNIKVMAYESRGQHRAVAVTDDYFVDVYDVSSSGSINWDFHALGPSSSAPSRTGTFSGDFTCTWPDHLKAYIINDGFSTVSMSTMSNVPYMLSGVSVRLVNPIYTTEVIRMLRVGRGNATGSNRYISVLEPLGAGAVLTGVERFNTANTAAVTGLKITAGSYTDYYFYNNGTGTYTLTKGSESITISGKWGFIRKYNTGTLLVKGGVTSHNISGTPVPDKVSIPQVSSNGGSHSGSVQVTLTCATGGADIYYTTNGSDPTTGSTKYTAPFTVTSTSTVKAIGIKSGWEDSDIASASFTITTPTVATPVINPAGGSYTGSRQVTITCVTSGAKIRYTTDGSTPTESSTEYTAAITLTTSATVKARAFASDYTPSNVASAAFVNTDLTVAAPVINPNGGSFSDQQAVTITCATSGAAVHYTTDGSTPTASSSVYGSALNLTATTTVKAIGIMSGKENSPVVSAVFTKGSQSVLVDDFEGGPKLNWLLKTPSRWEVAADGGSDAFHINTTDITYDWVRPGEYALLQAGPFTDYQLEVEGRTPDLIGTADYGIIFGYVDNDNFYYVSLNMYAPANYIYRVEGGARTAIYTFSEALASAAKRAYKLVVDNGQMTFYVDGSEKASFAENVPGGKVGLCTLDDECYFDNFKLTDLNASVVRVLPGSFTTNGPERLLLQMEGDQVGFTLSGAAAGELVLYGPAGERLCSLTCRANRTEHYSVAGLPSGAYYYGINTGGATRYGMMVIVK